MLVEELASAHQPPGQQLEAIVGLHGGNPDMPGAGRTVELARGHQSAALAGHQLDHGPSVAVGRGHPHIERSGRHLGFEAELNEHLDKKLETTSVYRALSLYMSVVVEGGNRRSLNGSRDHGAGVFSDLTQPVNEIGVAGVETGAGSREVRALGE